MNSTTLLIKTQTYCFLSEVSREVCGFVTQDWIRKLIIWNMYGQSKPLWKQIINVLSITGGLRSSAIILQNWQLSSCKIKSKLLIAQSFLLAISFSILHDREGSNYTKGYFRHRDGPHWCCLLSVIHIFGFTRHRLCHASQYSVCWRHPVETLTLLLALCQGRPLITTAFPSKRVKQRFFYEIAVNEN